MRSPTGTLRHLWSARRGTSLYLRARGIPGALLGLVVIALLARAAGTVLTHSGLISALDPTRRVPVVVAAPLLAAALFSRGLGGDMEELEAGAPGRWGYRRTLHVGGVLIVVGAALTPMVMDSPATFGALAIIRNVAGFVGIVALSAAVIGARLAWAPPLLYAAAVYLIAPRHLAPVANAWAAFTEPGKWWAWPMQSGAWDGSWISAVALLIVGGAAYGYHGSAGIGRGRS